MRSQTYSSPAEETVVVLQEGRGQFEAGGRRWDVGREGVLAERATALCLPPGEPLLVHAETPLEAVLVSTPAPAGGEVAIVRAQDVNPQKRSRDLYAREVHNLFVTDPHVRRLMVGETFNPPGHWSSFPPHKHDGRDGEPVLEEVYHYRIDPPQGFGHQMLYLAGGEMVTHVVLDGDAVLLPYRLSPRVRAARLPVVLSLGHGRSGTEIGAARRSRASLDPHRAVTAADRPP